MPSHTQTLGSSAGRELDEGRGNQVLDPCGHEIWCQDTSCSQLGLEHIYWEVVQSVGQGKEALCRVLTEKAETKHFRNFSRSQETTDRHTVLNDG